MVAIAKKLLQQMPYEVRFTAISHFYGEKLKKKITKVQIKEQKPVLTRQNYLDVSNVLFLVCAKFVYVHNPSYVSFKCYVLPA